MSQLAHLAEVLPLCHSLKLSSTHLTSGPHAGLLEERVGTVYKQAPGYSEKATSLFVLDLGPPQDLPDALRGESWLFVQLPLSMLQQELRSVESRESFGDTFGLATAGLDDLPADTLIPGAPSVALLLCVWGRRSRNLRLC